MTNNVTELSTDLRVALLAERAAESMRSLIEFVSDDAKRVELQARADQLDKRAKALRGKVV